MRYVSYNYKNYLISYDLSLLNMEDIRAALMQNGGKLTKKQYKFAVNIEKKRLFSQLIFLTLVSFMVALVLYLSLYYDIIQSTQCEGYLSADDQEKCSTIWMTYTLK